MTAWRMGRAFRERNVGPAIGREEGGVLTDRCKFFTGLCSPASPAVQLAGAAGMRTMSSARLDKRIQVHTGGRHQARAKEPAARLYK